MITHITNKRWKEIYNNFIDKSTLNSQYREALGFNFTFDPVTDYVMSAEKALFNPRKAAAMYFWYKKADMFDDSIIEHFPQYKNCIDFEHHYFNSNYGLYAYKDGGLQYCIDTLIVDHKSRRACFLINNNTVSLSNDEIDKLCTNAIQFFIRDAKLHMIVQMRSSNFITLLPYDAFMFSVFYYQVYQALKDYYEILMTGKIHMQIASIHYWCIDEVNMCMNNSSKLNDDIIDYNKNIDYTETKLKKYLL